MGADGEQRDGHPQQQCTLDGNCLVTNVVYSAKVETLDVLDEAVEEQSYTGLAENWKSRLYQHWSSYLQTRLSTHKDQDLEYRLTWGILGHARPHMPVSGQCRLCLLENYFILYRDGYLWIFLSQSKMSFGESKPDLKENTF